MYDPAIGRWGGGCFGGRVLFFFPYTYVLNNPTALIDPDGNKPCPPGTPCDNPLPNMSIRQNRASNLGPGMVRTGVGKCIQDMIYMLL